MAVEDSPWARFLGARADMIAKLVKDGESTTSIAATLSMDPTQVSLIAATPLASIVCTEAWHAAQGKPGLLERAVAAETRLALVNGLNKALLEKQQQASGWVPVAERLPDTYALVQFHVGEYPLSEARFVGRWDGYEWSDDTDTDRDGEPETYPPERVTYWRPLPPPPAEESSDG